MAIMGTLVKYNLSHLQNKPITSEHNKLKRFTSINHQMDPIILCQNDERKKDNLKIL